VHHREGDTTFCSGCGSTLVVRDWYDIKQYRLTAEGSCPDCGQALAGRFGMRAGGFGRRRIAVRIAA
jgi:pyruvate formate lyase activating enzyme